MSEVCDGCGDVTEVLCRKCVGAWRSRCEAAEAEVERQIQAYASLATVSVNVKAALAAAEAEVARVRNLCQMDAMRANDAEREAYKQERRALSATAEVDRLNGAVLKLQRMAGGAERACAAAEARDREAREALARVMALHSPPSQPGICGVCDHARRVLDQGEGGR